MYAYTIKNPYNKEAAACLLSCSCSYVYSYILLIQQNTALLLSSIIFIYTTIKSFPINHLY